MALPILVMPLLLLFFVQGCALPPPPLSEELPSLDEREFQVVSYLRDGISSAARGRMLEAEMELRKALYLRSESLNIRLNLATVLAQAGLFQEAEEQYRLVLSQKPYSLRARLGLAELLYRMHRVEESIQLLDDTLFVIEQYEPTAEERFVIWRNLATILFTVGQEEDALCRSAQVVKLRPALDELSRHARLLIAMGRLDAARVFLDSNMKGVTTPPPLLMYLSALVSFGQGDFDRAKETCRVHNNLVQKDPNAEGDCDWIRFLAQWQSPDGRSLLEQKARELREEKNLPEETYLHEVFDLPPYELARNPARLYWPEQFISLLEEYRESSGWLEDNEREA